MSNTKGITFETQGTCCTCIKALINNDTNTLEDIEFIGGCNGNLKGIKSLILGMNIDNIIEKLQGISCNGKPTSCPDQLATCLTLYKNSNKNILNNPVVHQ